MNKFEIKTFRSQLSKLGSIRTYSDMRRSKDYGTTSFDWISFFKLKNHIFIINSRFSNFSLSQGLPYIDKELEEKKGLLTYFLSEENINKKLKNYSGNDKIALSDFLYSQIEPFLRTPFFDTLNIEFSTAFLYDSIEDACTDITNNELDFFGFYDLIFTKFNINIKELLLSVGFKDNNYTLY